MIESLLEQGKEAHRAWKCNWHWTEFTEDLVPIFGSNGFLVRGNGMQNLTEAINTMRWKCDSFRGSVNEPPQYNFWCSPRGISLLLIFFDRGGFLTKFVIVFVKRPKHAIKQSEKNMFYPSVGPYIALNVPAKIIHINVPVTQQFFEGKGTWDWRDVGRCN